MCVTMNASEMSKTIIYAGEAKHAGRLVHVLGYQNVARNLGDGPNAMILPFPAAKPMTPENVVDTSLCPRVLKNYRTAIAVRYRSFSKGMTLGSSSSRGIHVFESGAYTVVLAQNALDIPNALLQVPTEKRPRFNAELFTKYAEWYPDWPIAVCCFDGSIEPTPLVWWFEPKDPTEFFAPALDAHDGKLPNLVKRVDVDHALIFGSTINPIGVRVPFTEPLTQQMSNFLPDLVMGREINDRMLNGDFWLPVKKLASQTIGGVIRRRGPGDALPADVRSFDR